MSSHGSKLDASACQRCDDGTCHVCKAMVRNFRMTIRRAIAQPGFAKRLLAVGEVVSGERIIEGGLPPLAAVESLLMRVSRAVQAERKAGV